MNDRIAMIITTALLSSLSACSGAMNPADAGAAEDAAPTHVFVHLIASHEPTPHAPTTSGQTPRAWVSGIRSLELLRHEDDASPLQVFSHGDGFVEASYAAGADTVVGSVAASDLEAGTYTWARVVHTHVRFTVDATLHAGFGPMTGELEDLIVLSDRTTLEGVERSRGDYRFAFTTAGRVFPTEGTGYTVAPIASGGFHTRVEGGETAYYFPVHLVVTDRLTADAHLRFEVNVHEGFRWTDTEMPDYAAGVFDITSVGTEPIVQAGANRYVYRVD